MMAGPSFNFQLHGVKELDRLLAQLPKAAAKATLRRAAVKALRPVASAARVQAPRSLTRRKGVHLADSIRVATTLSKRQKKMNPPQGAVVAYVGPTYPAAPHAHLIEFGVGPRRVEAKGKRVLSDGTTVFGRLVQIPAVPAKPFMRPAWDANKEMVRDIFAKEMWTEIVKAARRLRKQSETLAARLKARGIF